MVKAITFIGTYIVTKIEKKNYYKTNTHQYEH